MKQKKLNWPTDYDNMLKPYSRLPYAIIDNEGKVYFRSKVKGFFEHVFYDDRNKGGGYHSVSAHIKHHSLICAKYIWSKNDLPIINQQLNK